MLRHRWLALAALLPLLACGFELVGTGTDSNAALPGPAPDPQRRPGQPESGVDASEVPPGAEAGAEASADAVVDAGADAFAAGLHASRVTSGLVGLWEFEEGSGETVHDAVAAPLDLTIEDPSRVLWKPHVLVTTGYTKITSDKTSFTKAFTACSSTKEVTMEAWVESAGAGDTIYARILTMGNAPQARDFALGTYKDTMWWASMQDAEDLRTGSASSALTHVVATRVATTGALTLYTNAVVAGTLLTSASAAWSDYPLTLANTPGTGGGWLGTFHLVAIYCRALSPAEVATNFKAGPDP